MHDYWIGDRVWINSLQQEGIFEGEEGELAVVKVDSVKRRFQFSDITVLPEEEVDFDLQALGVNSKSKPKGAFQFPDSIDLHIAVLNPNLIHAEPAQILAHQRARLKDFLRSAIDHHKGHVTIIHGKGEGVLKSEVLKMLSEFPEVKRIEEDVHGGAVLVHIT